ncbi:hypothetical protein KKB64_05095 [Patescibacteria group bacterium]|nr:hypothetical protein [Patescibacteria group bacterium]MBU1473128.1 hypothetical protein [Patescibacteria group bacterium]MBU2459664.1 hypothetical protein [Patescibacteria group bacterium]MBU2544234.1 hypothetical protein [Patescibacteria group bacterium]
MKKLLLILFTLLTFLAIPVVVFIAKQRQELRKKAAPATTLSFLPAQVTKNVGDTFSLEVHIETAGNQVVAAELHVSFDPTVLSVQTITNGPLFPNILASGTTGQGTAGITVGATNTMSPVSGSGTAAVITFQAAAKTSSPVLVKFDSTTFVGALGEGSTNVLVGTTNATVTIQDSGLSVGALSDEISPTPTTTPYLIATPTITPGPLATESGEASPSALAILSPKEGENVVTEQPAIYGKAPPNSTVTLTIYSNPITTTIIADSSGNWTYTPVDPLPAGPHDVVASIQDPSTGNTLTSTTSFVVPAIGGLGGGGSESAIPTAGNTYSTLLFLIIGSLLLVFGLLAPVVIR